MRMVDSEGREQATIDVAPMREGLNGRFISLARSDLAAALFGACGDIPAHFGVSVASVEQDAGGVVATLSDGRQERFDLVVGADGLHSRVREIVFGPEPRFERFLDCYVAAFRISNYPRRDELTYVSHTVVQRQAARVSLRNGETLVLLVCRADLIGADPPRDRQKEAVRRAFGDMGWEVPALLEGMDAADDLYFDRVSQIHLPRWSSGRIGLLGDAAACPSLLAGEGTGLAMTEAYVLAGELDRADGDPERALAAYERRLRPFVEGKQKAALWLRGFFAPQTALGLGVRSFTVRALSRPFLARRLFARSLRDDFELPGYSASR
jgi:2-polyprenyl-6-methoxyphenol hydroxylase-like FAD-dependent oxidoreductase